MTHPHLFWLLRTICIALLLLAAAAACSPGPNPTALLPAPTAFNTGAAPLPTAAAATNSSALPTAAANQTPDCALPQLKGQASWQGATGSLAGSIRLDNPLDVACRLSGVARVTLSANNGQPLAVHVESQPTDVILAPGQSAQAQFVWSNYCGPAYKDGLVISLTIPDPTNQLTIPVLDPNGAPLTGTPRCDSPSDPSAFELNPFTLTAP